MEEVKSWLANGYTNNNSVFSQSSATTSSTTSQETHSSPTLCEEEKEEQDTSFNSLQSNATTKSRSHFCIVSIKPITSQISSLSIHNNTLYATSAEIHVFDLTTLSLIDSFGSGSGLVKSISFSNNRIFTAHQDSKIRVWKQVMIKQNHHHHHHKLISTLPTFKDRLSRCMLAKNYVQIHRHKRKLWIEHADSVSGLAVSNDVGLMYSVSWDKSLKIWKMSNNMRCLESFQAHSDAINAIIVNPIDGTIYTGSADGEIKVWTKSEDRKKHRLVATLAKHESSVNALALTKGGSILFSGGGDRVILVWEKGSDDGTNENNLFVGCSLRGHKGAILCLVCVNGVLISGSSDKSVRIWRYGNGKGCCVGIMEGHCKPVKSLVAINPGDDEFGDGNLSVFSGSLDGEIRAWKVVVSDESDLSN